MCKRHSLFFVALLPLCIAACNLLSAETSDKDEAKGIIRFSFLESTGEVLTRSGLTGSVDTNSFILSITSSSGEVLYNGKYCEAPVSMKVSPGVYYISAVSENFKKPAFDSPQWGDEQCVKVSEGEISSVTLVCRQMNCGVKITIPKEFLTQYPNSSLLLESDEGSLLYSYSEKRTAFFTPGSISLVLSTLSQDERLLTRNLCSGEILLLNLKVAKKSSSESSDGTLGTFAHLSVEVDTARTYLRETYTIGGSSLSSDGSSIKQAYSISRARENVGDKGVWVGGFVVGGDLTSRSASFTSPFKASSNLVLGPRSNTATRDDCISVQLPEGDARDQLNLVSNPSRLHTYLYVKGDIVAAYFGLVGIKNITDYKLK